MGEEPVGEAKRFREASNRLFDVLLFEEQPSAILDSFTRILGEALGVDRSMIYDISFSKNHADCLNEWLNPENPTMTPTKMAKKPKQKKRRTPKPY